MGDLVTVTIIKPLTVKQLAEFLDVSPDWVYTEVEAGRIPCTRLTGRSKTGARRQIRFTGAHVQQILAAGEQSVTPVRVTVVPIQRRRSA